MLGRGQADASALERLDDEYPALMAQVDEAVDVEFARALDDVMERRIPLILRARDQGLGIAEKVAQRMAQRLGWSAERTAQELAKFHAAVDASRAFRRQPEAVQAVAS